ncbi:MAG: hypothetical protein M4579_001277 [Chaenotheca gracillima]|nr:MAG: hypothetical protein M4579_001277 [Chaenotheca gracillima]
MNSIFQLKDTLWSYVSPVKQPVKHARTNRTRRPQPRKTPSPSFGDQLGSQSISPKKRTDQWLEQPVEKFVNPNEPTTAAKKHRSRKVQTGRVTKTTSSTHVSSLRSNELTTVESPGAQKSSRSIKQNGSGGHDLENDDTLVEEESLVDDAQPGEDMDMNDTTLVEGESAFENGDHGEDSEMQDTTLFEDEDEDEHHKDSGSAIDKNLKSESTPFQQKQEHYPQTVDRQELRRQRLAMVNSNAAGWTNDENRLYRVITMRGFEPLFPVHWRMDFPSLPKCLFCYPRETPFFNTTSDHDFHATTALYRLLSLGKGVRERVLLRQPTEAYIKRELEAYIKWSERDIGFTKKPYIPLIAFATPKDKGTGRNGKATAELEAQIRRKIKVLASRYRQDFSVQKSVESQSPGDTSEHLPSKHATASLRSTTPVMNEFAHQPPTLYGMLILHTVVAIATFNSANLESPLRTVAILDLGKFGQDVWNGLAIGAAVICARDWLCRSEALRDMKDISEDSDDPDA